jgi:hypothetical protein
MTRYYNDIPINWDAIFNARKYYRNNICNVDDNDINDTRLYNWMVDNWGVDHGSQHIRIIDENKYLMLLLKFL